VAHHQAGRLAEAEAQYRKILQAAPRHGDAWHLLGVVALQRGNNAAAVELITEAIRIRSSEHYYSNLGNALKALGRRNEAIDCYRRALSIKPDLPEAHSNLGNALIEAGDLDEGMACCRRAIALQPRLAEAHNNLANAFRARGEFDAALESYRRALEIRPGAVDIHLKLADTAAQAGRLDQAIESYLNALRIGEGIEAKLGFVACIKDAHFNSPHPEVRDYLIRAISEAWARPGDLLTPAKSLIQLYPGIEQAMTRASQAWPARLSKQDLFGNVDPAAVAQDVLFQFLLESVAINSIEFERLLTMLRRLMLEDAITLAGLSVATVPGWAQQELFYCAIARQCFINEYVYFCTEEELTQVAQLRRDVCTLAAEQSSVHPMCVAALAAYAPLNSLDCANALSGMAWPTAVAALLKQQIVEPDIERSYRASIPRLTAIDDGVSRAVQTQYEENPYPRWVHAPSLSKSFGIDALMRHQFPASIYRPLGELQTVDILIAGCGTGQHPVQAAQQFAGARVLAIDLSMSSLCYARRKTDELGLRNIAYAQADILHAGVVEETFDVIESVGVLHHLADPLAGWRALLGLLRPDGLMCVGLYSEIARRDIVEARSYIARQGYTASPEDMRRCRQDLMVGDQAGQFPQFIASKDFYGMSDCRDLLFHVQEHRYTLLQLKDILVELGLNLIGLTVDAAVALNYAQQFPDDPARINLDYWHAFEMHNPNTFARMYQFWVQKNAAS